MSVLRTPLDSVIGQFVYTLSSKVDEFSTTLVGTSISFL